MLLITTINHAQNEETLIVYFTFVMNVLKQIFVVVIKVLRNYEMVAQLPEECFALVMKIEKRFLAGGLPQVTKSQTITQSFF